MRLTSFEQSYTKQTPVTWQGHKMTPKKLHHCNHLFKHNILCEFHNLVNFPFKGHFVVLRSIWFNELWPTCETHGLVIFLKFLNECLEGLFQYFMNILLHQLRFALDTSGLVTFLSFHKLSF